VDPYYLGRFLSDIRTIDKIGEETYKIRSDVKLPGFSGDMSGILKISKLEFPRSFKADVSQDSIFEMLSAKINVHLIQISESSTLVNYKIDVKMPLIIKSVIGKKVKELVQKNAKHYFEKLENHLKI
jgi:carbon monoxide dehydrogenase subunit G